MDVYDIVKINYHIERKNVMKIAKIIKSVMNVGSAVVGFGSKALELADRIIHREEYERRQKRARAIKIVLCVIGGIVAVLLFPYKLVVKKNGDFEIRTLLLRVYRNSDEYDVPEGGSEDFDIQAVEDDVCECELVEEAE